MTQNYQSKKISQQEKKVLWQDINVQLQKIEQLQGTGVVGRGDNMNKKIRAPKGYHFMGKGKSLKLMKHKGSFKKHKGASLTASIKVVKTHS